ncbi:MAG: phosphoribosyltransferase family protein [Nonlabens sp.]
MTEILDHHQINHKINRIAYQIAEEFINESQIVLAGIDQGGYQLALLIKEQLAGILQVDIKLCRVTIDKRNPQDKVITSIPEGQYKNTAIVLCDDVLNSGTTLMYGVRHFLNVPLNSLKTAILINRNHKKYPVKADYKGLSLSTTMEEHIDVQIAQAPFTVTLA